jgi:hypothetical protein
MLNLAGLVVLGVAEVALEEVLDTASRPPACVLEAEDAGIGDEAGEGRKPGPASCLARREGFEPPTL